MVTEQQKTLIKATIPVLKENGAALTNHFYQRMLGNNPALKETFNLGHQRNGAQSRALAGAILAYAENIDDPSVLAPVVELICHKHVSLNIQAPDYAIVGENLLHSISEVLNIPMEDELIAAWQAAYLQLADLLIKAEAEIYRQHETSVGSWLGWRNFVVARKIQESSEITSFYLTPQDGLPLPDFRPGQYITVRIFVPELGLKQPRQYSLSDKPNGEYLRISVKHEAGQTEGQDPGYVSSTLHRDIHENDVIEVSAPVGNFYLLDENKTNVLISAGVGLTPMIAMLRQLMTSKLAEDKKPQIHFIYAARSSAVQAMKDELQALSNHGDRFRLFVTYENIAPGDRVGVDYHAEGRLDLTKIDKALLPADADYYLCGPAAFMRTQYSALTGMGIPQQQIHYEAFGTGGVALNASQTDVS